MEGATLGLDEPNPGIGPVITEEFCLFGCRTIDQTNPVLYRNLGDGIVTELPTRMFKGHYLACGRIRCDNQALFSGYFERQMPGGYARQCREPSIPLRCHRRV